MGQPVTDSNTDTSKVDKSTDAAGSGKVDEKGIGTASADKSTNDNDVTGLKSALQKERKRADAAEKAIRDGELAKLPELERLKTVADELTKQNEKLTIENMRMKIGMELNLKWNIAKRISGDTEAEMREDAADLLKSVKSDEDSDDKTSKTKDRDAANKAKTNDGNKSGPASKPDMNALMRRAAGRG